MHLLTNFVPHLLSLPTLILILLILLAGSNKHVLVDWFFLKADTTALSIAPRLANSTYLKDLSSISGTDLVGSTANASSLGLAGTYTVALFSYCAEGSSTICSSPKFGFHFDPLADLKLENTGLQGTFSSKFLRAISSYGSASHFLWAAYVLAFIFTFFTPAFTILAWCAPRAIIGGPITSLFSTIFLLIASSVSISVFNNVKGEFNSNLASAGVKTGLGNKLFVLSWIATVFSLISTVLVFVHARRAMITNRRGIGKGMIVPNADDKDPSQVKVSGNNGPRKLTLLQRSLTWNRHRYANIDKQKATRTTLVGQQHDDEEELISRGFGGGEDENDLEEEELARGSTGGIPLTGMGGNKANRDMNTAYEPFRQSGGV